MIHSPEIDQLAAALVAAQGEFVAVKKEGFNPHFKSTFAELADVVQSSLPIATQHGLCITHLIGHDGQHDILTTLILHKSGQYLGDSARLILTQENPQAQGSATTYGRRYGFMAALNLVADSDDDGQAASKPNSSGASVRSRPGVATGPVAPDGNGRQPPAQRPPPLAAVPDSGGGPMTREQIEQLRRQATPKGGGQ